MIKCFKRLGLGLIILLLNSLNLEAAQFEPFHTQNQSPLISIYGLPSVGGAKIKAKTEGALRLTLDLASNHIAKNNAQEMIVMDGEITRLTLSGRYGLGNRLELGIDVPFLIMGGGFLDHFIEDYHAAFGFPNGGRELAPQNRLLYRYQKNGVTLLNMERSGQGFGDVSFNGGWQIYQSSDSKTNLALRGTLKLPTGDTGSLRGSGSVDLALWLVGSWSYPLTFGQLTLFGAAGDMGMTKSAILTDQQRPFVGFGALGLGFRPADWIELKIQTNAHTSFYSDSGLDEIHAPSAQLTMGGALHLTPKTSLDIGVTEDMITGTSPDVVFHFSLRHTF